METHAYQSTIWYYSEGAKDSDYFMWPHPRANDSWAQPHGSADNRRRIFDAENGYKPDNNLAVVELEVSLKRRPNLAFIFFTNIFHLRNKVSLFKYFCLA